MKGEINMISILGITFTVLVLGLLLFIVLISKKIIQLTLFVLKLIKGNGFYSRDIPYTDTDIRGNDRVSYTISTVLNISLLCFFIYDYLIPVVKYGFMNGVIRTHIHFIGGGVLVLLVVMFLFDIIYTNKHCRYVRYNMIKE